MVYFLLKWLPGFANVLHFLVFNNFGYIVKNVSHFNACHCIKDTIYIYKMLLNIMCHLIEAKKLKYILCYARVSRKLRFQTS